MPVSVGLVLATSLVIAMAANESWQAWVLMGVSTATDDVDHPCSSAVAARCRRRGRIFRAALGVAAQLFLHLEERLKIASRKDAESVENSGEDGVFNPCRRALSQPFSP